VGVAAGAALGGALPAFLLAWRVSRTVPLHPMATFGPGLAVAAALAAAASLAGPHVTTLPTLGATALGLATAWALASAGLERALLQAVWHRWRRGRGAQPEAA
jgi:hypothetical protein